VPVVPAGERPGLALLPPWTAQAARRLPAGAALEADWVPMNHSVRNIGRVGLGVLSMAGALFFAACLVQTIFVWWKHGLKTAFWTIAIWLIPVALVQMALGLGLLGLLLLRKRTAE
jgi:hypothetical protein